MMRRNSSSFTSPQLKSCPSNMATQILPNPPPTLFHSKPHLLPTSQTHPQTTTTLSLSPKPFKAIQTHLQTHSNPPKSLPKPNQLPPKPPPKPSYLPPPPTPNHLHPRLSRRHLHHGPPHRSSPAAPRPSCAPRAPRGSSLGGSQELFFLFFSYFFWGGGLFDKLGLGLGFRI